MRESLPARNFSNSHLSDFLTHEVAISIKKSYVITLKRSPSKTSEFDSFVSNLEKLRINHNKVIIFSLYYLNTLMLNPNLGQ